MGCKSLQCDSWRFLKVPTPTPPGPSIHLQTSAPLRPGAGATNDDHQDICCVRTHFSHFFSFLFFVIDCHVQYLASQRCGKGKDECVSVCDYWNLGDDYWASRIPWLWEQPDCHIRQSQPMLQRCYWIASCRLRDSCTNCRIDGGRGKCSKMERWKHPLSDAKWFLAIFLICCRVYWICSWGERRSGCVSN